MLKLTFIFIIPFCFVTATKGQSDYFNNNPVWKIQSDCAIPFPCIENRIYNYYINGDTIINNYVYYKMFLRGNAVQSWNAPPPPIQCQGSYVLNDTINPNAIIRDTMGTVFLHNPQSGEDTILYNFNLSVGDTLPLSFNNPHNDLRVISIDSILVSNIYRKRFEILDINSNTFYLIEGIGHEGGFLEVLPPNSSCAFELLCYSQNDTSYYPVSGLNCEVVVSLPDWQNEEILTVSPNPSFGFIYINKELSHLKLKIYSSNMVLIGTFLPEPEINLQERFKLSEGFYFIEIENLNSLSRQLLKLLILN